MSLWLPHTKSRLGALLLHGTTSTETSRVGHLLSRLSTHWREYLLHSRAASPGFTRASLYRFPVNWGDMDSMGHVNNVQYTRYAESGRVNYVRSLAPGAAEFQSMKTPHGERGLILRGIKVEYKFPVVYPDRVSVFHAIAGVAADGMELAVVVVSERHQRVAASVWEDIVVYDYRERRKVAWGEGVKAVLEAEVERQAVERRRWEQEMGEVVEEVGRLESEVLARKEM